MSILALEMILKWNAASLKETLPLLVVGMLGIFAVILVIWLLVAILNRATANKTKDGAQQ